MNDTTRAGVRWIQRGKVRHQRCLSRSSIEIQIPALAYHCLEPLRTVAIFREDMVQLT